MFWWFACSGSIPIEPVQEDSGRHISEPEFVFSIAILADPHISGSAEHSARLNQAIEWINEHQESRQIELVPVLGDVGWETGLSEAKLMLDTLSVPYIPIIGDNEIQYGDEERFTQVFSEQFDWLSDNTESWVFGGGSVWNPEEAKESFFTNMAFTHRDIRFVSLDWASRLPPSEGFWTEFVYLHDFEGGTLEFFQQEVSGWTDLRSDAVVVLTHIPMIIGSFNSNQMNEVEGILSTYMDKVYANFAGHLHVNVEDLSPERGYDVYITDAIWNDVISIRMLDIYQNEQAVYIEQEMIELHWSGE